MKQVGLGFLEKNNQTTGIVKFAKFIQFLNQDDTQIDDMKWIEGIEMGLIDSGCWHLRQKFVELFQIVQLLKTDILYRDVRVTTECMDVLIPALEDWVNVASKYADQRVFIGAADVYYTELLQTGNRNFYSLDQDVWKKAEVVVLNRGLH